MIDSSLDTLLKILANNKSSSYLKQFGEISTYKKFSSLPLVDYEDIYSYVKKIKHGDSNVLFSGEPLFFEKTSGTLGEKVIPYSFLGIEDIKIEIEEQYFDIISNHNITGGIFLSISPFWINGSKNKKIKIGLKDEEVLSQKVLEHFLPRNILNDSIYKSQTIEEFQLNLVNSFEKNLEKLEFISIWSPSYLINILKSIKDFTPLSNRKNLYISSWVNGFARLQIEELKTLLPNATIIPKGLMLTEGIITKPFLLNNEYCFKPSSKNFIEYRDVNSNEIVLFNNLKENTTYEAILTTNNGLYRYKTSDLLLFKNNSLVFIGRDNFNSDLCGEKISESFLSKSDTYFKMFPNENTLSYEIFHSGNLNDIRSFLFKNPHFEFAVKSGQLKLNFISCLDLKSLIYNYNIKKIDKISTIKDSFLSKDTTLRDYLRKHS